MVIDFYTKSINVTYNIKKLRHLLKKVQVING